MKQIPHSHYHWNRGVGRFFEGWYYRVTLPEIQQSFAFMYAIDDPQGHTPHSGGSVQVLGIDDKQIWRTFPNTKDFHADRDRLYLEHWNRRGEGYSASDLHNKGKISDPVHGECDWDYEMVSVDGWGNPKRPTATMGFYSYLSIFEPGWQILMARGLATGAIAWQGKTYEFANAPAYIEKNWGRSFPKKWFWIQCNAFPNHEDLSITVAGGIREHFGIATQVAMVGINHQGKFYNFMPENSEIHCKIQPWGDWQIEASSKNQQVEIIAKTEDLGTWIMVPSATGLQYLCRDTTKGSLQVTLKSQGQTIKATSQLAGLEVGGEPWSEPWEFKSAKL
ncbi:tocopherol cyclase family protein [Tumidithrix elongata RA019]|uniref:Tocopherol cyclase family protein n=1 Tax=Tumidithrix elongata BACA0141 TaxID=2716417 RepID=A0AAW9Q954_9CYAN|nr:tocopherol cyclase family protein [Tumidithrix elongata RA019]